MSQSNQNKPPQAISPEYTNTVPNQPNLIWEGPATLHIGEDQYAGFCKIEFEWIPSIGVKINLELPSFDLISRLKLRDLIFKEPQRLVCEIFDRQFNVFSLATHKIQGRFVEPLEIGTLNATGVSYYKFHLANFIKFDGHAVSRGEGCSLDRLTFADPNWKVIIDKLECSDELVKSNEGLFVISHVGTATPCSNSLNWDDVFERLHWFLAFCAGRFCSPCFVSAHDVDDSIIWTTFPNRIDLPKTTRCWVPIQSEDLFRLPFNGFSGLFDDERWKRTIQMALYWYRAAHLDAGGSEGSIILIQAALEMLAREQLNKHNSSDGAASELIRELLILIGIDTALPDNFGELRELAKKLPLTIGDGPECITSVRNSLVHSKFERREEIYLADAGIRLRQLKLLSLHYLELILLWKFDYEGLFYSKIKPATYAVGAYDKVPWSP